MSVYAVLIVACALLALTLGCGDDAALVRPAPVRPSDAPPSDAGPAVSDGMLIDAAWWDRSPAVRILLTGGLRGKLKPCGCSSPQLGGLKRMAAVLHQLRRRARASGGLVAAVSLGWTMRGNSEAQEEAKADFVRAVYESLGFSAALLGSTDLLVPAMSQPRGQGVEAPRGPLNVFLGASHAAGDTPPLADFNVGKLKVRAMSVLDPERAEDLRAGGFIDAVMSVSQALGGLRPAADKLWLVGVRGEDEASMGSITSSLKVLGPGVVVDVSDGGAGGKRRLDHVAIKAGSDPLVVEVGELGKAVGVLDVDPAKDGNGWIVSFRRIELVPQWTKYGKDLAREVASLDTIYRDMVKQGRYLVDYPRVEDDGARYVGSGACATCHAAIYNQWKKTPHASALETLRGLNYHWDPECIRCHVVGWQRAGPDDWLLSTSGFRSPAKTPFLGGVGCETCHGPGGQHAADPWKHDLFTDAGPNGAAPTRRTCVRCHDIENSHGFIEGYEAQFLPQVDHRRVPRDLKTVLPEGMRPPPGYQPRRKSAGSGAAPKK